MIQTDTTIKQTHCVSTDRHNYRTERIQEAHYTGGIVQAEAATTNHHFIALQTPNSP